MQAIARGTNPDNELAPAAANDLAADGLHLFEKPTRLSKSDLADAEQLVTFCELPGYPRNKNVVRWKAVPAVSENYIAARDALLALVTDLLDGETKTAKRSTIRPDVIPRPPGRRATAR